jgi:hypothetical protein
MQGSRGDSRDAPCAPARLGNVSETSPDEPAGLLHPALPRTRPVHAPRIRLGDLRRWAAEGTPGQVEDMTGRDLCFPIGESELQTNQNLG